MAVNDPVFMGRVTGPRTSVVGNVAVWADTNGSVLADGAGGGAFVESVAGTTNQVLVNGATAAETGAVTLSLSPTLAGIDSVTFSGGQSLVGTATGALVGTSAGPYVFGSASTAGATQWAWVVAGSYANTHALVGGAARYVTRVTMPDAVAGTFMDPRGLSLGYEWDFGGKTGAVDQINVFEVDPTVPINRASATIRNTALIHTFGDMNTTATGKNYSLWVDEGTTGVATTRLDGTLYLGPAAGADITATNAVQITHSASAARVSLLNGTGAAGATMIIGDGAAATPAIARFGQETGIWFASNLVRFAMTGVNHYDFSNVRATLYQGVQLGYSSGSGTADLILSRGAANRLVIQNAAEDTGASVTTAVDGVWDIRTRAGADTATTKSNIINATGKYQINGTDGVSFSGVVTNITVVNGIVTAAS